MTLSFNRVDDRLRINGQLSQVLLIFFAISSFFYIYYRLEVRCDHIKSFLQGVIFYLCLSNKMFLTPLSTNFSSKCYLLFEKVSIFCKFFLASHVCIQTAECTSSASSQSYSTIDIFGEQALSILEKHKESQWCFCCHCSHFRLLRYLLSLSERPPFARYFLCKAQERVILLCTCKVSK